MLDLKERTIRVIQRDRLADFLRISHFNDTGCFYFALIMSWNYLFPNRIINRQLAYDITNGRERLGVAPNKVISEIQSLQKQLNLRVARIGITNELGESVAEFRELANIPSDIQVVRESYPVVTGEKNSSALVLWMGNSGNDNCLLHYTSSHSNDRFSPEERAPYHPEYAPIAIFHLQPSL